MLEDGGGWWWWVVEGVGGTAGVNVTMEGCGGWLDRLDSHFLHQDLGKHPTSPRSLCAAYNSQCCAERRSACEPDDREPESPDELKKVAPRRQKNRSRLHSRKRNPLRTCALRSDAAWP